MTPVRAISASRAPILELAVALLAGCAPVYYLKAPSPERVDIATLEARLADYLATQGVKSLGGPSQAMSGDIGCGLTASDRQSFGRFWQDSWGINKRIVVHEFTCDDAWYVVIVSSQDANRDARQLRDGFESAFAPEITSGNLQVKTRCRVALE